MQLRPRPAAVTRVALVSETRIPEEEALETSADGDDAEDSNEYAGPDPEADTKGDDSDEDQGT